MRVGSAKKCRLDKALVDRGFFADEQQALRSVLAHEVKVDETYARSAALLVDDASRIEVKGQRAFVSRAGLKLQAALDAFNVTIQGARCIDAGSSTGGFTHCLLEAGAASVTCVDVNYGQLAWSLRSDSRVQVFERTNIRLADPCALGAPFDVAVADLSFISLASLASVFARLVKPQGLFMGLVKPQFESLPGEAPGGVVRFEEVRIRCVEEVCAAFSKAGFRISGYIPSPIKGPSGNVEYMLHAIFEGSGAKAQNTAEHLG